MTLLPALLILHTTTSVIPANICHLHMSIRTLSYYSHAYGQHCIQAEHVPCTITSNLCCFSDMFLQITNQKKSRPTNVWKTTMQLQILSIPPSLPLVPDIATLKFPGGRYTRYWPQTLHAVLFPCRNHCLLCTMFQNNSYSSTCSMVNTSSRRMSMKCLTSHRSVQPHATA